MHKELTKQRAINDAIEDGLLTAFCWIVLYWLMRFTVRYLLDGVRGLPNWLTLGQLTVLLGMAAFLLLSLTLPHLQKGLGRFFLPVMLLWATGLLGVEKYWQLIMGTTPTAGVSDLLYVFSLQPEFILPLLLIAWQYSFGVVLGYALIITTLQWGLLVAFTTPTNQPWALLPEDYVEYLLVILLIGYVVTWLMTRQRQQRATLATVNQRLLAHAATVELLTVTQERNRLARELHDTLAHTLTALTVQLGAIGRLWDVDRDKAQAMLVQADQNARDGVQEARRSLQALRAAPLAELGLVAALHEVAQAITQRGNLILHWQVDATIGTLPPLVEQALYRVAQEALENVVRHAEAQQVTVTLAMEEQALLLAVQDDGVGFAVEQLTKDEPGQRHWGLQGIHERIQLLGGTVRIESQPRIGTTLWVRIEREQIR